MGAAAAPFLARVPLFEGALAEALDELASELHPHRLDAREELFAAGEPADRLFVVHSGRLEVVVDVDGEERVVRVVGPGAVLGELALLTGSNRSATVRAVRDSELLELDAERFESLLASQPALALGVARELARQLQASGGLLPPAAAPTVFAVVAASTSPDVERFWRELTAELASAAPSATVDADDLGYEPNDGYSSLVDRLETTGARLLLLATADAGPAGWPEFCLRQADRVLLVAEGDPDVAAVDGKRCDLVFLGRPSVARIGPWLDRLRPRTHHVVRDDDFEAGVRRVARRIDGRAIGLVFSGGGARGFAHVGAYEVLVEEGVEIDRVGGCSMGSLVGALVASGLTPAELRDACRRELVNRSPFNDYTVPRIALIRARKAAKMLQRLFGETYLEELSRPAFTVSADLITSELVVHRRGLLWETVGASMSIPGLVPPLQRWGRLLVDGGVLNNLPVDTMADDDEGPIVAVDVIRRLRPDAEGPLRPPTITETLARATVLGSVERAEGNRKLAKLVIAPDVDDVGLRAWRSFERAVDAGRRAAEEALEAAGGTDGLLAAHESATPTRTRVGAGRA